MYAYKCRVAARDQQVAVGFRFFALSLSRTRYNLSFIARSSPAAISRRAVTIGVSPMSLRFELSRARARASLIIASSRRAPTSRLSPRMNYYMRELFSFFFFPLSPHSARSRSATNRRQSRARNRTLVACARFCPALSNTAGHQVSEKTIRLIETAQSAPL